jgi:hypothetical protein
MADFLSTLFGGGAEKEAADKNRQLYAQYGQLGTGYLDKGFAGSQDALGQAKSEYDALNPTYTGALTMLGNAYGLNGASGNQAAQSSFTTSPGYQQGIDAGLTAINRRRVAGGMLDSGNADLDALNFAQNNQNQQYQNWLQGLTGLSNNALTVAGAKSGVDTSLANLYQTDATNRVGLQGNVTSGDANANVLQAQGESAGAKNLLGAGLSLASLAAGGGLGGGIGSLLGGAGGMGSALGGLGMTYGMPGTKGSNLFGPTAP